MVLIAYKEVTKTRGEDLSEIFYQSFFIRVWQYSDKGFQVTAQASGEGNNRISATFDSLDDAMVKYNRIAEEIQ